MADPAIGRVNNPVFSSKNKLKIGLFCTNTYPVQSEVPENFEPSWENCLEIGQMADAMGLEAIVPIARWKGYLDGRFDHRSNEVLDTFTYAAAMAQATRYSGIFATTHAPTVNPVFVAKQTATIDAISNGRFNLNIVGGWNRREFDMFGIEQLGHEERYIYLAEWIALVRRLWTENSEFDYQSENFAMKGALSRPQPRQKPTIPIMNAGLSPSGQKFAAKNSDIGLIQLFGSNPDAWAKQVNDYKDMARREFTRDIQVWTNAIVTIGDTQEEAEQFLKLYSEDMVDEESVLSFLATLATENGIEAGSERYNFMKRSIAIGMGAPVVGDPEFVATRLTELSQAGLDGIIMTFVDFKNGLLRFGRDVLPRLEANGVRHPFISKD